MIVSIFWVFIFVLGYQADLDSKPAILIETNTMPLIFFFEEILQM